MSILKFRRVGGRCGILPKLRLLLGIEHDGNRRTPLAQKGIMSRMDRILIGESFNRKLGKKS